MRKSALKLVPALLVALVGGCAPTSPGSYGVTRYEYVILKNPYTGKTFGCRLRETTQTAPEARSVFEASQRSCVRNAQAAGYTHMIQVTRWP